MSIIQIEDVVERKGTHIMVALVGESGSGKTLSGLLMGRGLAGPAGKLYLLDTESGRGRHFADKVPGRYGYAELTKPYTGSRYIQAIRALEERGCEVLVIDSTSHEWEGYGGVLEQADLGKDSYGNALNGLIKWAKPKAAHKAFVQALLDTRMHLIFCLRAKEKMVQIDKTDPRHSGRTSGKEIISEGFVSIQDKRFIYEMTAQLFMQPRMMDGVPEGGFYVVQKCNGDLRSAFPQGGRIGTEAGAILRQWISGETAVDKTLDPFIKEGMEAAERGTPILQAFWGRADVKPRQKQLVAHKPNWMSIAEEADRALAEETQIEDEVQSPTDLLDVTAPFASNAERE